MTCSLESIVHKHIKEHFPMLMPADSGSGKKELYHYTDIYSFERLTRAGADLLCTRCNNLNDDSEFKYGLEFIFEQCLKAKFPSDKFWQISEKLGGIGVPWVFCFSLCGDSLHHWTAYTNRMCGGVAIGFDAYKLHEITTARMSCNADMTASIMVLLPCLYDRENSIEFATQILPMLSDKFLEMTDIDPVWSNLGKEQRSNYALYRAILVVASQIKHPAFQCEKEWRLVFLPSAGDMKIGKCTLGGKERVYARLFHCDRRLADCFSSVRLSPHGDNEKFVELLMESRNLNVKLRKSAIPYNGR